MTTDKKRSGTFVAALGKVVGFLLLAAVLLAIGFVFGWGLHPASQGPGAPGQPAAAGEAAPAPEAANPKETIYTCSMHPQIRQNKPGRCPICGMELIPVEGETGPETGAAAAERKMTFTEEAKALMQVETAPVERRFVEASVRMVGKVNYDETRMSSISAWVAGRIDRLYVNYTGIQVNRGDHMADLFSPELLSAQEELLQAIVAGKTLAASDSALVRQTATDTVAATREKLRLLGLTAEQVTAVEKTGKASDHVTIYAPVGGIVVTKDAVEGMYVETGTRIYSIADLSTVWVKLDAYESDLVWLRYGQKVAFETVAYPGVSFQGTIAFIDPIVNPATRTVSVRVNTPNADGRLKPEMFVKAVIRSSLDAQGRVTESNLAGKWICPMHPEIVQDKPGKCPICGMDLVTAESLGYVAAAPGDAGKPLVIPAAAPLITGKRAVVYVEVPDQSKPTYEGRVIELGARAGDYYVVVSGLSEGERVVTRGSFKIDAEMQIRAKPSMMSPEGGQPVTTHQHGAQTPAQGQEGHQHGQ